MTSVIVAELQAAFPEIRVNGHPNQRLTRYEYSHLIGHSTIRAY
jgi:hypothetical protein